MRVIEIGKKNDVKNGSLCETDFALLEEIQSEDTVIIMQLSNRYHCFLLISLARWFFDHALTWNTMPRIPTTGETVPRSVYREVIHAAMNHFPEFMYMVQSEVNNLSDERRAYLEANYTQPPPPPPPPPTPLPESIVIPEDYSPAPRRRGRRDSFAYVPGDVRWVTTRRGRRRGNSPSPRRSPSRRRS
jgi:hypothetical protein